MNEPNRTLVSEVRLYFYSDNTLEYRKVALPPRNADGRIIRKPKAPREPKTPHVSPDPMVSCPACGAVFRVGKKLA